MPAIGRDNPFNPLRRKLIMASKDYLGYTITIEVENDEDNDAPWDNDDGHGSVSDWRSRYSKQPGERILHSDRNSCRFYNWQEAMQLAKRDGWGLDDDGKAKLAKSLRKSVDQLTAGEIREEVVRRDFEYLRGWCNDEWHYVGYTATITDEDGNDVDYNDSCWGFDDEDYMLEEAFGNATRHIDRIEENAPLNCVI